MLNFIKNALILSATLLNTSIVLSEVIDIKLNCKISVTRNFSTGTNEKEQLTEIFEIYQNINYLGILSSTNNFASVNTSNRSGWISTNASNQNKWDITMEKNGSNQQIVIDRNTGQFFYSSFFQAPSGGSILTKGDGTCTKVDTNKKVF